jgi:SAM-dependent methyltransferase
MKDNFSHNASGYAAYRPSYPDRLFQEIRNLVPSTGLALDVGTGSGQVAVKLSEFFDHVEATDISEKQIQHAQKSPKINYSVQPAEKNNFGNGQFDLITVGQAIHWFDFDRFYKEVYRVAKADAVIAVLGYGLFRVDPEVDNVIDILYQEILGSYWDPERRYIDEEYKTIPFPFEELHIPASSYQAVWDFDHLIGFLNTWSAVKHYENRKRKDPLELILPELKKAWENKPSKLITFPIINRIGKILK